MTGVLTALILFGIFPGLILGFILLSRYLKFRETKLLLEHGITPPQPPPAPMQQMPPPLYPHAPMPQRGPLPPHGPMPPRPSRAQLTWGLVLSGIGLALTLGLWPIGLIANGAMGTGSPKFPLGLGPWMLAGFIPLFVGLALILGHVATQHDRPTPPTPFPTEEGARWSTPLVPPPPLSLTEEMLLRPDPLAPPRPASAPPPPVAAAHPEPPAPTQAEDMQTPPVVRERE